MKLHKDGYYRKTINWEGKHYVVAGKTEKETLEKWADLVSRLKRGENAVSSMMSVAAWSETWLNTYIKPKVRTAGSQKSKGTMTQKSYKMYEQKLNGTILPQIKNLKLKDVKDVHLQRVLNNAAGMSQSHVSKLRIVIQMMFGQAYISRLIPYDPSSNLILPVTTQGTRRSLTDSERDLLLETCKHHRCGLWIRTLLDTGIRPSESAPLLIKDFDFKKNTLNIDKSLEGGAYVVGDPKTAAGTRKVPLPEELIPDLKKAFFGKGPFDFAFPNTTGGMKSATSLSNDWRSFVRDMDIRGGAITIWRATWRSITTHGYEATAHGRILEPDKDDGLNGSVLADDLVLYCLRHTYCTDLQKAGVPIDVARQLMGHADISTTSHIYTHSNDEVIVAAAENINAYKSKKLNGKLNAKEA